MQKTLFCAVAVATLLCFLASNSSPAQAEMVTNGTFDSDLSGWTGGGAGSTSWDASTSPDGGCLLILGQYEAYPEKNPTMTLPGGGTLYVSYSAYSPDASGNLVVRIYDFDGSGFQSGGGSISKTTLHQGWGTYPFEMPIPASLDGHQFTITFDSIASAAPTERVYIDNVTASDSPIPEPGTLALIFTGLMGLLTCARRKWK